MRLIDIEDEKRQCMDGKPVSPIRFSSSPRVDGRVLFKEIPTPWIFMLFILQGARKRHIQKTAYSRCFKAKQSKAGERDLVPGYDTPRFFQGFEINSILRCFGYRLL